MDASDGTTPDAQDAGIDTGPDEIYDAGTQDDGQADPNPAPVSFHEPFAYVVNTCAAGLVIADFNSDGHEDFAISHGNQEFVGIMLGDANAQQWEDLFSPETTYSIGVSAREYHSGHLGAGDFNADGIVDLAVTLCEDRDDGPAHGMVAIMLGGGSGGYGDGTFYQGQKIVVGNCPWSVAVEDFDSDGILDLAVANSHTPSIEILSGNGEDGLGDGTFSSIGEYGIVGGNPRSIIAGDFNSDGTLDLAISCHNTAHMNVMIGGEHDDQADGTFSLHFDTFVGDALQTIRSGDFNSDGIIDLVTAGSSWSDNLHVLLGEGVNGQGNGYFQHFETYSVGDRPVGLATVDFNLDGIPDIAVAPEAIVRLFLSETAPSNGKLFGSTVDVLLPVPGCHDDIVTGDFDDNGRLDLAVLTYGDHVNVVLGRAADE